MKLTKEASLIATFTFLTFILGTTEYIIVGLIDNIALSLQTSVSQIGFLVSAFAISFAIGTPTILSLASGFSKKTILLTCITIISLLNVATAFVPNYFVLLLIRCITAICCGLSVSLAISISSDHVAPNRRGKAISYIIGGFSLANVLGVPIGTFIGNHFHWTSAFLLIALIGMLCIWLLWRIIPASEANMSGSLEETLHLIRTPQITLAFLIPIFATAAIFTNYTYIIPIMLDLMHIPSQWTSIILLAYGAATIVSNFIGGFVASGDYLSRLRNLFILLIVFFILFSTTINSPLFGILCLLGIACFSFAFNAAAQLHLIQLTEYLVPKAKDVASSLMPVGGNVGIAIGSAVGAFTIDHLSLSYLPWVAGGFALLTLLMTILSQQQTTQHSVLPDVTPGERFS